MRLKLRKAHRLIATCDERQLLMRQIGLVIELKIFYPIAPPLTYHGTIPSGWARRQRGGFWPTVCSFVRLFGSSGSY